MTNNDTFTITVESDLRAALETDAVKNHETGRVAQNSVYPDGVAGAYFVYTPYVPLSAR